MSSTSQRTRQGSYGLDAPAQIFWMGGLVILFLAAAVIFGPLVSVGFFVWFLFLAVVMSVQLALYVRATRRGKFEIWDELLDDLDLRGDERLLDLGCGRGAVLLAAARRLPDGRAVGIDLWRTVDQSGNARQVTERNAAAEGVADRVELRTADMIELPFGEGEFDVIVSSLAIHNIPAKALRAQAVSEALRVLRPGGRLVIVDIFKSREYEAVLRAANATDLTSRGLGWRMWWGGPWVATRVVTATR